MRHIALALIIALFPFKISAQTTFSFTEEQLSGLVQGVFIEFDNNIGDCWTNEAEVKQALKNIFRENGVAILRERPGFVTHFYPIVKMYIFGRRAGDGYCVGAGHFKIQVEHIRTIEGSTGAPQVWLPMIISTYERPGVFTDPSVLNDSVMDLATASAEKFTAEITRERLSEKVRVLREIRPDLFRLVSAQEWNESPNYK